MIESEDAEFTPLTGGVSSDIYRVQDGDRVFAVKRALPQLRVEATWFADIGRNASEVAYIRRVREFAPKNLPSIHTHNSEHGYFTMELLGAEFLNWKAELLFGRATPAQAEIAGSLLGCIHRETWEDRSLLTDFDTTQNFHELRLDPYLLATAERHPALAKQIRNEAQRIRDSRQCLVHGDYSPKNLLFADERIMLLDCEVAWFGDAAFDIGFLLNHLTIKALHVRAECLDLARLAWKSYLAKSGRGEIETDVARLLPMLMLARVDGKSPLEYLGEAARDTIRSFANDAISNPAQNLIDLWAHWQVFLPANANC